MEQEDPTYLKFEALPGGTLIYLSFLIPPPDLALTTGPWQSLLV